MKGIIEINGLQFPVEACKKLSKKDFIAMHKAQCEKRNISVEEIYEQIKDSKASKKK